MLQEKKDRTELAKHLAVLERKLIDSGTAWAYPSKRVVSFSGLLFHLFNPRCAVFQFLLERRNQPRAEKQF